MRKEILNLLVNICQENGYTTPHNKSNLLIEDILEDNVHCFLNKLNSTTYIRERTGVAKETITRFYRVAFPDRDPIKDKSVVIWLLAKWDLKFCTECNEVLPYEEYSKNTTSNNGLQTYCKSCTIGFRREAYLKNSGTEIYNNSLRKADIQKRAYSWGDKKAIIEFYNNTPEGCHVDHIIPIHGRLVSGLHVIHNLQYLTKEENLSKNNRFLIE